MAAPLRQSGEESPPLDATVVDRAYRLERARRKARIERDRARQRANTRFAITMLVLVAMAVVLALVAWRQIQGLFGL